MKEQLSIPFSIPSEGGDDVEAIEEKREDGWYGHLEISRPSGKGREETADEGPFLTREALETALEKTFDNLYPIVEE